MAHYLSEVTHLKLDQRVEPATVTDPQQNNGLIRTHMFESLMRCTAVVDAATEPSSSALGSNSNSNDKHTNGNQPQQQHQPQGDLEDLTVWSGDIDGSVIVRKGITGRPVINVEKKPNVFAYCILYVAPNVWVGFSDGYVAIYDALSYNKIFEMRAHTQGVNAMIFANNSVYTAGCDWQIVQWDPFAFTRVPHGQLSGHQNGVRALAVGDDPTTLFSAGDDYAIRCWDLAASREKGSPWPIVGHRGTVRAIAVNDVYLFSGSTDGTLKVWNTQTAQLTRQLEDRPGYAINAIMLDRANDCVWAGGTDGVCRLWDSSSLTLSAEVTDHSHTHVAAVAPLARISAFKAWGVNEKGEIKVWYSDQAGASHVPGEAPQEDRGAPTLLQQELQRAIDMKRDQIVGNYKELQGCRLELEQLERDEATMKTKLAGTLGAQIASRRKQAGLHASKQWLEQQQRLEIQRSLAALMHLHGDTALRSRYFMAWGLYVSARKAAQRKVKAGEALQMVHQDRLKRTYASNIVEFCRRQKQSQVTMQLVSFLRVSADKQVRQRYFRRFVEFRSVMKFRAKRALIAANLSQFGDRATRDSKYRDLHNNMLWSRARAQLQAALTNALSGHSTKLTRACFAKWAKWIVARREGRKKGAMVNVMYQSSDRARLQCLFQTWVGTHKAKKTKAVNDEAERQRAILAQLRQTIDDHADLTEDQLEDDLLAKQEELALITAQIADLDRQTKEAYEEKRRLQREFMRDVTIASDEPQLTQLQQAMYLIKARGVNVFHNFDTIEKSRNEIKEETAEEAFRKGVQTVREVCQKVIKPEQLVERGSPVWYPGSLFDKIKQKSVLKASLGLVKMVTAFDTLTLGSINAWVFEDSQGRDYWSPKAKHMEEALTNFGTLLELSMRAYRYHRKEDMVTGEPLTKKQLSPKRPRRRSASPDGQKPKPKKAGAGGGGSRKPKPAKRDKVAADANKPTKKVTRVRKPKAKPATSSTTTTGGDEKTTATAAVAVRKPRAKRAATRRATTTGASATTTTGAPKPKGKRATRRRTRPNNAEAEEQETAVDQTADGTAQEPNAADAPPPPRSTTDQPTTDERKDASPSEHQEGAKSTDEQQPPPEEEGTNAAAAQKETDAQ